METRNRTKTKATNRVVLPGRAVVVCPDCKEFTNDLRIHLRNCPRKLRLCKWCGRDVRGGDVCGRCTEGGAHVDEQRDRQTIDVFAEDIEINEKDEEQESREEYYGL